MGVHNGVPLSKTLYKEAGIMQKLKIVLNSWSDEYRLIKDIWGDEFPKTDMYKLSLLEKLIMSLLVFVRSLSAVHLIKFASSKTLRSQLSENYVLLWFVALILFLFFPSSGICTSILIAYRLIDGFNYRLCIVFVDRYKKGWGLRSINRSFMLLLINYLEMIIGFAALYVYTESIGKPAITSPWESLYFSVVTITTLGYGDFSPVNEWGQFLVATQTLMGVVFVMLVVSTFLTGVSGISNLKDGK